MAAIEQLSALIVKEPYISLILEGKKTWELRARRTHHRGLIALIAKGSGTVVGVTNVIDVLPAQTDEQLIASIDKHQVKAALIESGGIGNWRIPWVLSGSLRIRQPVSYSHPTGAVIWVTLSTAESAAVLAQLDDGAPRPIERGLNSESRSPEQFEKIESPGKEDPLVPVAKDGSWFHPGLARGTGTFQIGAKGAEQRIQGFDAALKTLASMKTAKWRRPNSNENWGIVSAVTWRRLSELTNS